LVFDRFWTTKEISSIKIYPVADNEIFAAPDSFTIEIQSGDEWMPVPLKTREPANPIANTENTLMFDKLTTTRVRINFAHAQKQVAISEIECY
jgi:hypothetical protein